MRKCAPLFGVLLWFLSRVFCGISLPPKDFPVEEYPIVDTSKNASHVFKIGLLGYFIGNDAGPGVTRFAVESINSNPNILPNVQLQLFFCHTDGTKAQSFLATETLIQDYDVGALVGARTAEETEISNIVASLYNVPQIGAISVSPALSDKKIYSYYMRVNPPAQYQNAALISLMLHEKWNQAFVIYSNDPYGIGGLQDLQMRAAGMNINLYGAQVTNGDKDFSALIKSMQMAIEEQRVRIFIVYTQANYGIGMLNQINEAGLIGNDTKNFYIMMDAIAVGLITNQFNISDYPYIAGSIGLVARGPVPGPVYDDAIARWTSADTSRFPGIRPDPTQSWYYYDAVYTIARALDELLQEQTFENITGAQLLSAMTKNNFTGVTGTVSYDNNYDRKGDYVWYNLHSTFEESFAPERLAAIYDPLTLVTSYTPGVPLLYNGQTIQPDGLCPCVHGTCDDRDACHCQKDWAGAACTLFVGSEGGFQAIHYVLVTFIPVLILCIIIVVSLYLVRRKRRALIKDMTHKQRALLKRSDILLGERIGRGASGEVFKGMFRGTEVAVKKVVTATTSQTATEQFEMECAIMTALRHPNIVLFMGMCLVPQHNELLLVMELMERGSLHDIIHNKKIPMPHSLCVHIAYQAAKGMNFLHQSDPPIIHCDLKSANILMDDKWNARISDFGITRFKQINDNKKNKGGAIGTIYWTAPEVFLGSTHTEACDSYSFGIVLWELFHRATPYRGSEPMLVASEVQEGARPILKLDLDPAIRDLILECWSHEPSSRPSFEVIMNRLRILSTQNPQSHYATQEPGSGEAPAGTVYFVATEILGANELWDSVPLTMCDAMNLHNHYIRHKIENNDGYEVECNSKGFLVAFRTIKDSINFCILAQMGLLHLQWPSSLLDHPLACMERLGTQMLHNGLRVRMMVHVGVPGCHVDHAGRMKYIGPVVDTVRNMFPYFPQNSVVISGPIMENINIKGIKFPEEISVLACDVELRTGTNDRTKCARFYDVLPKPLVSRRNLPKSLEGASVPNAVVVDMEEEQYAHQMTKIISSKRGPSWDISLSDLSECKRIAQGAIADYICSSWKGREVLQKVLLNQQVGEKDILVLKARTSILTKLHHKNLVQIMGACLEPGHISLVMEYLPKSVGLQNLLLDPSISLSYPNKVKIAKQIAEGMQYLSTQEHVWLRTHGNLKSNNVLVDKENLGVKVNDFGQGNLKDMAHTMTAVGAVAWTAPEVLNGEEPSEKISVYSFGIIMWEIYTREFPYTHESPVRVVAKIVTGYRPAIPLDCPAQYTELMTRCWSCDPAQRPSWGDILAILSSL